MTNDEIRELLALFNDSGVAEMEIQRGENRVRFRRASLSHDYTVQGSQPQMIHHQQATIIPVSPAVMTHPTPPMPPSMSGGKPSHNTLPSAAATTMRSGAGSSVTWNPASVTEFGGSCFGGASSRFEHPSAIAIAKATLPILRIIHQR